MATINPTDASRRSFVYRRLLADGATFESLGEGSVSANLENANPDATKPLSICDLSGLPRIGIKGRDALDWLRERAFEISDTPNRSYRQHDGTLVAVLAPNEAVLLSPINPPALALMELAGACSLDDGVRRYAVPRADSNFEYLISGEHSSEMFSKVCGVDLRPAVFAADGVAQTSVARLNAIVMRADVGEILAFRILGDSASAEYMWDAMLDAMAEYSGVAVGLNDIERS